MDSHLEERALFISFVVDILRVNYTVSFHLWVLSTRRKDSNPIQLTAPNHELAEKHLNWMYLTQSVREFRGRISHVELLIGSKKLNDSG